MTGKLKKTIPFIFILFILFFIQNCKKADLITTPITEICDTIGLTYVDFYPAWSPDGSKIIFFHNDALANYCGLYIIDTNGTNKHILKVDCNVRNPDWSPDGNWIVYETENQLHRINRSGFFDTLITHNITSYYPTWRSDNAWIAFDSFDSLHYYAIWKIRPDGTGKKFIGEVNSGGRMPDWSPDGKYICYQKTVSSTQTQIYVIDTLGNPGRRVTSNDRKDFFPKFSPDGTKILYQSQSNSGCINIYVINADGTGDNRITNIQSEQPSWSPDGQMIVYVNVEKDDGHIWIMKKDGSGKIKLTN